VSQEPVEGQSPLQARIEGLVEKGQRAERLHEDVQEIEQQRQTAKYKNEAFDELQSVIEATYEQYDLLQTWVDYAKRMGLTIPTDDIESRQEAIERDIYDLLERSWADFEDAEAVGTVHDAFETHREDIKELTDEIRSDVQQFVDGELESVERTMTLLQIPDIGDEDDRETCEHYKYYLGKLARGTPRQDVTPHKWTTHHDRFHALDIDLGENLSQAAKDVIWNLLNDETVVTLADLDEAVLDDLKTFEEFSKRLSIQFKTNER
jgi:DNA-binding ferritin-like protein (Dps family)